MTGTVMVMAAQNTGQRSAPSSLPVTGAANNPLTWGLAALALALLGVGLRFAQRASHP